MKIALIQQHATKSQEENMARGLEAIEKAAAAGAKIVCFAELAFEPFYPQVRPRSSPLQLAETIPGSTTERLCQQASDLEVVIVFNLFERAGELSYDSSPVIDADGSILGVTRMVHITEYEHFYERDYYAPGDQGAPVYETRYGKIGVAICYDRHFPEYMRALGVAGAELVVVPQAGAVGEWPEGLFEAELRVASFQNGYYSALCNRVGPEEHLTFAGESFVCNPNGTVVARAESGEDEVLVCDIDLSQISDSDAKKLFLRDRREELYPNWIKSR